MVFGVVALTVFYVFCLVWLRSIYVHSLRAKEEEHRLATNKLREQHFVALKNNEKSFHQRTTQRVLEYEDKLRKGEQEKQTLADVSVKTLEEATGYVKKCQVIAKDCLQQNHLLLGLANLHAERAAVFEGFAVTFQARKEAWKSYAIALETLCECCGDEDEEGANNARKIVTTERKNLRQLGEYE